MKIILRWNGYTQEWVATTLRGHFLQEFKDCTWFNRLFRNPRKDLENHREVDVKDLDI